MENNSQQEILCLEDFLKKYLSWEDFENLHQKLGLSRKMLTLLLRQPRKIPFEVLMQLSTIAAKPINEFTDFLNFKTYGQGIHSRD